MGAVARTAGQVWIFAVPLYFSPKNSTRMAVCLNRRGKFPKRIPYLTYFAQNYIVSLVLDLNQFFDNRLSSLSCRRREITMFL
jgi:hypothetical protein